MNERIVDVSRVTRFQFTHPGKGATPTISPSNDATRCFNSRTLGRVRLDFERLEEEEREFQFTHPGRGATKVRILTMRLRSTVSIHAPREGCDYKELSVNGQ